MTLDLTPAPGSAPLGRQVLAQASMEARLMLRNGEQLLLAVVAVVVYAFRDQVTVPFLGAERCTATVAGRCSAIAARVASVNTQYAGWPSSLARPARQSRSAS